MTADTWYAALGADAAKFMYAAFNVGIFLGYGFIAAKVIPLLPLRKWTRIGGYAFFATCALTHFEQALHTYVHTDEQMWRTWHMQAIHLVQVIAVWTFAFGFFTDVKVMLKQHTNTVRQLEGQHRRSTDV